MQISGDQTSLFKKYDFSVLGTMLGIFTIGVINLYSATHAEPNPSTANLYKIQMIWFCVAMAVGVGFSLINTKNFFRVSYIIYALNIVLLVLVLVIGKKALGAQRWLDFGPLKLQPSEMMKVSLVMALSRWYSRSSPDKDLMIRDLLVPGLMTFIPAILVIIQPDLGTGMLLILIFLLMTFYRKLQWRSILIIGIIGLIGGTLMYRFGLKEYQRKRIITFIDPTTDARGSGYNAIQSEIAVGSGRLFGKGFKKSSQAYLSYLPENHTDFVFSIYNEEHGLFGSLVLMILYILLLMRFIWLSTSALKIYNSILAIGLMSIIFCHTFINMGMVTGLLPIVGVPLPFMSYGGSNLLTFLICGGMATAISNSRTFF